MTTTPLHPNKRDAVQVEVMTGMGCSVEYISKHLNLSIEDLTTHYNKQLEHGQEEANLQVAKVFHDLATSGEHPAMTVAWMKMRGGWTENIALQSSTSTTEDSSSLDEAKEKLLKLLNRAHNTASAA